ncbi:LmeA family phospholipid-binding protein [Streptomyces sp. A5-4]|uniref:LmeA family phospholipid-binding protein n=1 Tax=Streptomyces sp. A5-4 TaxID=3384771 RepID=UPI003DA9EDAE
MRALRILLIFAVVLGGIFVAVDRIAVNMAESEVADRVQNQQGLGGGAEVSIKGFPFLTQVAAKRLDQVDVTLKDVEASAAGRKVRVGELAAELHDVKLQGSLTGFTSAKAARATGTATVSYADLTRASEEGVRVSYGGNGKVKVTGSIGILGRTVTRSVLSTVSMVDGNTIRVRADEVPGEGIPGLEGLIRKRTDFDRQIGGLPDGLKLEKIEAREGGAEISVTGTDVELAG